MRTGSGKRFRIVLLVVLLILLVAEILLAAFSGTLLKQYYRKPYSDLVTLYAGAYGVPESLVYAVMLCESGFRADAQSPVGAKGLMQMMDVSFREMRSRLNLPEDGDIFDPEQNIQCGVYCLSYLHRYFGNWRTALAAYNAGIGNVGNWLQNRDYSSDGKTLEVIPFEETAAYLKKVEKAQNAYRTLYGQDS